MRWASGHSDPNKCWSPKLTVSGAECEHHAFPTTRKSPCCLPTRDHHISTRPTYHWPAGIHPASSCQCNYAVLHFSATIRPLFVLETHFAQGSMNSCDTHQITKPRSEYIETLAKAFLTHQNHFSKEFRQSQVLATRKRLQRFSFLLFPPAAFYHQKSKHQATIVNLKRKKKNNQLPTLKENHDWNTKNPPQTPTTPCSTEF